MSPLFITHASECMFHCNNKLNQRLTTPCQASRQRLKLKLWTALGGCSRAFSSV